jgi:hypothetical protein
VFDSLYENELPDGPVDASRHSHELVEPALLCMSSLLQRKLFAHPRREELTKVSRHFLKLRLLIGDTA